MTGRRETGLERWMKGRRGPERDRAPLPAPRVGTPPEYARQQPATPGSSPRPRVRREGANVILSSDDGLEIAVPAMDLDMAQLLPAAEEGEQVGTQSSQTESWSWNDPPAQSSERSPLDVALPSSLPPSSTTPFDTPPQHRGPRRLEEEDQPASMQSLLSTDPMDATWSEGNVTAPPSSDMVLDATVEEHAAEHRVQTEREEVIWEMLFSPNPRTRQRLQTSFRETFLEYERQSMAVDWCCVPDYAPNKFGGSVQGTFLNVNKLVGLAWASAIVHHNFSLEDIPNLHGTTLEASHLCDNALCIRLGHVVLEPQAWNNARKGCLKWIPCPHDDGCQLRVITCAHTPLCVKAIDGHTEQEVRANPELFFHVSNIPPRMTEIAILERREREVMYDGWNRAMHFFQNVFARFQRAGEVREVDGRSFGGV